MRTVEEAAVAAGASLSVLMREAGRAVAAELAERVPEGDVVVLAGHGNNGGDGWIAALELRARGRSVLVLSVADPATLAGPAAEAAIAAIAAGVSWRAPEAPPAAEELAAYGAVIDALLGVGASGALREPLGEWARAANECGAFVVAVDLPTGVDADSGAVHGPAIHADCTVTFTAPKRGLVQYPGAGYAGEIVVADIGIAPELADVVGAPELWTAEEHADLLPIAAQDAHKNERGRVLVIAGSAAFPGAAVLAARGAMRMGAGYVTVAVPESVVQLVQGHLVAATVVGLPQGRGHALSSSALDKALRLARDYDAVVLGPGLTQADGTVVTVRGLVTSLELPLVIDADALNALVDAHEILEQRSALTVLTPHPGELARLLGKTVAKIQADRIASSARLAGKSRAVVLKGAGTVTSVQGRQVVNTSGTQALATAGTGDVLAGMVGALLAQGLAPFDAGALAAYIHGRAGEAAGSVLTPVSVTAEDLPDFIPEAIAELLGAW
jgi:NAD(P)H-hydrate epimerase